MVMWTNCQLLLFTRYPEPGKTKTRLIPELGAEGAALLQKRLTERVVLQGHLLAQRTGIHTTVYYSGGSRAQMTAWLGSLDCIAQADGDLGQRMHTAFVDTFAGTTATAVLIGSDIPDITADLLQQAFSSLLTRQVVIGPSQDGGYYLIGLHAHLAEHILPLLFARMQWSTGDLLTATTRRLKEHGYSWATLPTLRDIDVPADLPLAEKRGLL